MILRGERIARDVNRFDLRLRRQLPAFEAVHSDHGVGARHVGQLLCHLGWIVRQRFNLLARQRRAESCARVRCDCLGIASDGDFRLDLLDRQHDHVLVVAAAETRVLHQALLETGKRRLDRIPARSDVLESCNTLVGRLDRTDRQRFRRLVEAHECHRRVGHDGAALIHNRHDHPRARCRRLAGRCASRADSQKNKRRR